MTEIEKVTNSQAKARSIYNSLIKDNIFYTGISKNLAIALIELGIDSSATDNLSVEKLQERCDRYEKALTEISKTKVPFRNGCFHWEDFSEDALKAQKALAAIGGDDE